MINSMAAHEWRGESPVHDRVKELEQEVAELRRDAERYVLQGYIYSINDTYVEFSCDEPPEDAYDEGSLVPVYAVMKEATK